MYKLIIYMYIFYISYYVYCDGSRITNYKYNKLIDSHRIKKRDVDLQTCIDNFDVHKDKIIRTQDSRIMGAKYLNEIDLGSRNECLRLCCETESCDVFVFEEKVPGSCYLFHCGPPEDFKCKFTTHLNYSSAVLAVSREKDYKNELKVSKHEYELSRLKNPQKVSSIKLDDNLHSVSTTPPTIMVSVLKHDTKPLIQSIQSTSVRTDRVCSRYQFECRASSECIAIYNACDGIPQCSDGSDEAPELECPPTAPAPIFVPVSTEHSKQQESLHRVDTSPPLPQPINNYFHPQNNPRYDTSNLKPLDFKNYLSSNLQDLKSMKSERNHREHQNDEEIPYQQMQQPMSSYERGIQIPPSFPLSNEWKKINQPFYSGLPNKETKFPDPYLGTLNQQKPELTEEKPDIPINVTPENKNIEQSIDKNEQQTTNTKINVNHSNSKTAKHKNSHSSKMDLSDEIRIIKMEEDMYAPNGAILSLILGIFIIFIMTILIACRIHLVKKRLRRNIKSSFAHDADYLVNGMYL